MNVEDALKAMSCIDQQHDGTEARAVIVDALHRKLLEAPETFWDAFFEVWDTLRPNNTRDLAERLLRTGAVHGLTTLGDAASVLKDFYSPQVSD
ncbi:MAG: hypothetical protein M3O02_03885 [Acidobacteriota bacterium]|nr:hypothetical protein [Acidobacteriota bacterium]